jgi:hypothetical protein
MRKYACAIEAAVDHCWPAHPTIYFISDCDLPKIGRCVCLEDGCWTEILLNGLLTVQREHPQLDYLFLILDDHCPLQPCDSAALANYLDIAREHDLGVISFPTYDWPWARTEWVDYPDGLVRTWRRIDIEIIQGYRLAVVPYQFFRYFQIQPAFWKVEYLVWTCRAALAGSVTDPWAFEAMRLDGARRHYIADYKWPSVHHGFIAEGKINPEAISYMSRKHVTKLRQQLIRECVGCYSPTAYEVYQTMSAARTSARRLSRALARRLQRVFK